MFQGGFQVLFMKSVQFDECSTHSNILKVQVLLRIRQFCQKFDTILAHALF